MDEIVPFRDHPATSAAIPSATRHAPLAIPATAPLNLAAVKTTSDYLLALRRRVWLILAVAVPMAIATSILALRLPRIYQARAEITIEPPEFNPVLSTLVSHEIGRHDPITQERYIPNRIALLQSKSLAERVFNANPAFAPEVAALDDPAQELILNWLQVRQILKTNMFLVTLEGKDPARTKNLLETLLEEFRKLASDEKYVKTDETKSLAEGRLKGLKKNLEDIDKRIYDQLKTARTIGPGGRNIFEEQYINWNTSLMHKQMRFGELNQQLLLSKSFSKDGLNAGPGPRDQQIALLETERKKWTRALWHDKHTARNFDNDPAAREHAVRLNEIMNELNDLRSMKTQMADNPTQLLDRYQREIEDDKAQQQAILAQMQETMPEHQKYLAMVEDRNQIRQRIAEMERSIASFEILASSQKDPVRIPSSVVEPTVPVRPSRVLYIGMGLVTSFSMGIGLVFLLEHADHCVKVPEHVTHGLTLPLLGVVPRIRRTSQTHRGGHLWTPSTPHSIEADAFRNIRASLLGIADRRGPMVTLLVTSPKAGDGKSTAALNLAATCARAGERTLLLDIDLRRPTLAEVFPAEPHKEGNSHGLIDVLQGVVPWQKTLRHTELCNLDFIPTGDPSGVPIEILGTLELRQLLTALEHHYDRVILDGPAVLGMADCRMLGRMVDASVLVVRAGVHQLVTLQRAKAMLEQSHVTIVGVVVNSLSEDARNWSSYHYGGVQNSIAAHSARSLPARAPMVAGA